MSWVLSSGPGTMLHAVQQHRLFKDSKHFVDMPLRPGACPQGLMDAFTALPLEHQEQQDARLPAAARALPDKAALRHLIEQFFSEPASDLEEVQPVDMGNDGPAWIGDVQPKELSEFIMTVFRLWRLLCRRVSDHVLYEPEYHTLLYLSQPFIIAGDRFRECYYWDSYWVVRGLLACDMGNTARDVVMNLLSLVDTVGHVPNGARNYYRNRSQPPLISAMVMSVSGLRQQGPCAGTPHGSESSARGRCDGVQFVNGCNSSIDIELLRYALSRLIKTWQYWTSGPKSVKVVRDGTFHTMSRYHASWDSPRPESYREDWELAASQFDLASQPGLLQARRLWHELASAAESGWDFSSRWCHPSTPHDLASTQTTQILPVDLNAFIAMLASDIASIAHQLGEKDAYSDFNSHSAQRWASIHTLMWCEADGCWHDLIINSAQPGDEWPAPGTITRQHGVHAGASDGSEDDNLNESHGSDVSAHHAQQLKQQVASNWVPLWAGGVESGKERAQSAINGLRRSGLIQPGGLATSLVDSGQQWDGDNAWPPLQHMMIEGLRFSGMMEGQSMANTLASQWLGSVWSAFLKTGHMHEKYNAKRPGQRGGGGEYDPQVGFGWTNGIVLDLIMSGYLPSTRVS